GTWNPYVSGTPISTTGSTGVKIRASRNNCTAGSGCTGSGPNLLVSWAVVAQPSAPTLDVKTPDLVEVCEGQDVSATVHAGSGGDGCTDSYRFSTDNGSTWDTYTPGDPIDTLGATVVLIQGKRDGCTSGAGCNGTTFDTLATWTVNAQPVGPTLGVKTP